MLEKLKKVVFQANIDLVKHGLVIHTWVTSADATEKADLW